MRTIKIVFFAFVLLVPAAVSRAYVEPVHERITQNAFKRAITDEILQRLGMEPLRETALRACMRGSREEDFLPRPLHHFYAPFDGLAAMPLTIRSNTGPPLYLPGPCVPMGQTAPDWALVAPENEFGIDDAHEHLHRVYSGISPHDRFDSLADLFETLGHVLHLNQDMAQPEHTRNDQHLPLLIAQFGDVHGSMYEEWTGENIASVGHDGDSTKDVTVDEEYQRQWFYDGYPTVKLPTYRNYWHRPGTLEGLADYSNRNFVTQDTNHGDYSPYLHCVHFPEPTLPSDVRLQTVSVPVLMEGGITEDVPVTIQVYTVALDDRYSSWADADPYHTVRSGWDFESESSAGPFGSKVFSLNENSYLTRALRLVPRAVGYSAGLLEHFFRGRIDTQWTRNYDGSYDVRVRNLSGEDLSAGTVRAYYMTDDGTQTVLPLKTATIPTLKANAANSVVVKVPPINPDRCTAEFERRIVVQGRLGIESGAVIGHIDPPNSVLCNNSQFSDCIDGVGCGTPGEIRWELTNDKNVDVVLSVYEFLPGVDHSIGSNANKFDISCFHSSCVDSTPDIPNSSVGLPPSPGATASITVQVPAEPRQYKAYALPLGSAPADTLLTLRVYHNGNLHSENTYTLKNFLAYCQCWGYTELLKVGEKLAP